MPKISVLMGVYNNAATVEKSIDAILEQSYGDFEFIICDDGSSDNTPGIVKKQGEKDSRIVILLNEENRGLAYALNRCLSVAQGEYCARMDGDDLCDETRFKKQADFLDSHAEYGFISTTMKRFDENGIYQIPEPKPSYTPTNRNFVKGSPFCHAPVMVRRAAYEAVGGYRDIAMTRGVEDYDLWFRLYAKGIMGYVLTEPLYSMYDGRNAAKRRTFKRRLNEAKVRWEGYRLLRIPLPLRIYTLKPILIGLIPQWLYKIIR